MSPVPARLKSMFVRNKPTPVVTSPGSDSLPADKALPSVVSSTHTVASTSSETMHSSTLSARSISRAMGYERSMSSSFVLKVPVAPGYCF
ncbi:hypothetical protein DXG03_004381 [Asterophora parasitica]|uniref:Uncharacterized protein n=1 Tax=Asterophora parasitica TaxID=117018 RepID=A0A9P7G8R7_9AGAR|nr:hypothetical protein DXG03_004381 [Asterophora parasitica]